MREMRCIRDGFVCALVALALSVSVSGVVLAQDGSAVMPENAHRSEYGTGWECDRSYREADGRCLVVSVPANAYPTHASYGLGWKCNRGYREEGAGCAAIKVPAHGYLADSVYGSGWACERGYRVEGEACIGIKVPAHGYLMDASYGSGWACERATGRRTRPASPSRCLPMDTWPTP
jgi:hypothetical protein